MSLALKQFFSESSAILTALYLPDGVYQTLLGHHLLQQWLASIPYYASGDL